MIPSFLVDFSNLDEGVRGLVSVRVYISVMSFGFRYGIRISSKFLIVNIVSDFISHHYGCRVN